MKNTVSGFWIVRRDKAHGHKCKRARKRSTQQRAGASAFLGALLGLGALWAADRPAAAAYNLTIAYSGTTTNVSTTTVGSVTTFAATGTGAMVTIADIATTLSNGNDVVVDSGSTGTEAGDITYSGPSGFSMIGGNNRKLTIQSGTGTGLVGDITLPSFNIEATNQEILVNAQRNIVVDGLSTDLGASGSVSLRAVTGSIQKVSNNQLATSNLTLQAATAIGTLATPILSSAGKLEAQTSTGGIVVTNSGKALTVGGISSLSGIQVTGASGVIQLINDNSITVNGGEKVIAPGNITIQANGTNSDFTSQHSSSRAIKSNGGTLSITTGRDIIIGTINGYGDVGGQTATFNAGRDMIINTTSYVEANGGPLSATVGRNFSILQSLGGGSIFNNNSGGQPISITTGTNGVCTIDNGFNSGVGANGGPITINADDMVIASSVGTSGVNGIVTLQPVTAGRNIDLGTDTAGTLGLTDAEIDKVTAGILRIGRSDQTGNLSVSAAITPARTTTLSLRSGGTITESLAGTLVVDNLALQASSAITLDNTNNQINKIAANALAAAGLDLTNSVGLTVDIVDGVTGITSQGGNLVIFNSGSLTLNRGVNNTGGATALYFGGTPSAANASVNVIGTQVTLGDLTSTGRAWTINDSSVTIDGNTINYTANSLTAVGGSGNDTFNVTPSAAKPFYINDSSASDSDTLTPDYSGTTSPAVNPTTPGNGTVSFGNRQSIVYTNIEIVTAPVNAAPVNTVPGAQTTDEDNGLVLSGASGNALQIADADAGSSPIQVTLAVTNGTLTLTNVTALSFSTGDGTADATMTFTGTVSAINAVLNAGLRYAPTANFNGAATLTITTNDQGNTGTGGAKSDTDTVAITISAVNDAPIASNQSVSAAEDTPKAITLTATDIENSPLTYSIVAAPQHGTLTGTDANLTYTPAANYNGPDSFTFKANDGGLDSNVATISITVIAVNDRPVASAQSVTTDEDTAKAITLTATDIENSPLTYMVVAQPQHGTLSGTIPNLTYTPDANYNGADSFNFKVNDSSLDSETVTVSITVTAVNDAPVAVNDAYTVNGASLTVAAPGVLGNDSDVDSNTLTAAVATGPTKGTVTLNANGSFTYTANSGTNSPDSFTYTVSDGLATATGTVTLTVTGNTPTPLPDTLAPTVAFTSPLNGARAIRFPAITGVARDGAVNGALTTGVQSVLLNLRRASDGLYWNGRGWSATATDLRAALSGPANNRTFRYTGTLPTGTNLLSGIYYLFVVADDGAANRGTQTISVRILDAAAPTVTITSPRSGATLTSLTAINGTLIEEATGSGPARVILTIRRGSDGAYWNGARWVTAQTALPTTLRGTGNRLAWNSATALPAAPSTGRDNYIISAYGYDRSGNRGVDTVAVTVSSSGATLTAVSNPGLSTISANAATQSIDMKSGGLGTMSHGQMNEMAS